MAKNKETQIDDLDNDDTSIIEFSEDISTAEAPEPLPERDYPFTISGATRKVSTNTGNPFAQVQLRINEEDYPADFDANNAPGGKTISHIIGLTDDAPSRHRLRKFMEAIGAPMSKRINLAEWVGLTGKATVSHQTYEGVKRERVAKVEPA